MDAIATLSTVGPVAIALACALMSLLDHARSLRLRSR